VVKIVVIPCVVVGHEQKKEAISPPFVLREVDKVKLISMSIATHIISGEEEQDQRWNRSRASATGTTNMAMAIPVIEGESMALLGF